VRHIPGSQAAFNRRQAEVTVFTHSRSADTGKAFCVDGDDMLQCAGHLPNDPMSALSEADRFLLEQVRAGDTRGWAQLVERYEGRLLAFARARLRQRADAEDLVQETFLSFLRGLKAYREQAGLETYLFTILRRKIIDVFRGKRLAVCSLSELATFGRGAEEGPSTPQVASADPNATWYLQRDEDRSRSAEVLAAAIKSMVDEFKSQLRFQDLQLAEMLFYAQLRNKDIAEVLELTQQQVALFKHRWLKRVHERVTN